ncbi:MAG TPA: YIP1 family protein [Noviherbaspirillum sp.]|nr:YIP1 family protein [Noviherbaspirillum sp.]
MSLLDYAKLPFSFHEGWDEIRPLQLSVSKTFLLLVLPFSLLPPLMLLYAGSHHGSAYLIDAPFARWIGVALAFLAAELLTVPLMGWAIRSIAQLQGIDADYRDTFRLSAITAIPMWLSSTGLASADLGPMFAAVVLGLFLSAGVLYHGSYNFLQMRDPMQAQALSCQAFAVGGMIWAFLCGLVILPLIH